MSLWQTRVAREERNLARKSQERAERITSVIMDIIDAPDPTEGGRDVRVLDIIPRTLAKAEEELADDPEGLTSIRYALAGTYHNLGQAAEAERLYRLSFGYFDRALGPDAVQTGECASVLAKVLLEAGSTEEGLRWHQDAVRRLRRAGPEGEDDLAWGLLQYSACLFGWASMSEAEPFVGRRCRSRRTGRAKSFKGGGRCCTTWRRCGVSSGIARGSGCFWGRRSSCWRSFRRRSSISRRRTTTSATPSRGRTFGEAEAAIQRSLEVRLAAFQRKHVHLVQSLAALSGVVSMRNDHERAEWLARDALELYTDLAPAGGPERYGPLLSLGGVLLRAGRATEAVPWLRELVALSQGSSIEAPAAPSRRKPCSG